MQAVYGVSDAGCVRKNNEDAFLIDEELGLYLVADGMGGAQAGEHASKLAVETVQGYIRQFPNGGLDSFVAAFEQANARVMEEAGLDQSLEGMGTTLVGVLERGAECYIVSVGDSRAYLFEGGILSPITQDQTWVNEVGRRLGLEESNLRTHPMRHVLTMAIGVGSPLRVHSYLIRPEPGCIILLSSDGMHGVVEVGEIRRILETGDSLLSKCNQLIAAARRAGGPDNITALLIEF